MRSLVIDLAIVLVLAVAPTSASEWHSKIRPDVDLDASYTAGSDSKQDAFQFLLSTTNFFDEALGEGGGVSAQVRAFRILLSEPDANDAFLDLYERGTLVSKLYALCAFYHINKTEFEVRLEELKSRKTEIRANYGCIIVDEPLEGIVERIRSGELPVAFGGAPLGDRLTKP